MGHSLLTLISGVVPFPAKCLCDKENDVAWNCHYTIRMFPPAIDIIPTSLAVVYSNGKYTNYKN